MNEIICAIKQLIEAVIEDKTSPLSDVKAVYYGDPRNINESNLPAITVQPVSTEFSMRGSRYDEKTHQVEVSLVYNQKSYFTTTPNEVTKVKAVEDAIAKIEARTGSATKSNTLAGLIQHNSDLPFTSDGLTVKTCQIARVMRVDYKLDDGRGYPTFEVVLSVQATVIGDR